VSTVAADVVSLANNSTLSTGTQDAVLSPLTYLVPSSNSTDTDSVRVATSATPRSVWPDDPITDTLVMSATSLTTDMASASLVSPPNVAVIDADPTPSPTSCVVPITEIACVLSELYWARPVTSELVPSEKKATSLGAARWNCPEQCT
jgi:hypothetical protein